MTGESPLLAAAGRGDVEVVRYLCDACATLDLANARGKTPIWYAAWLGYTQVLRILLDAGASVDYQDCDGRTPLHATSNLFTPWVLRRKIPLQKPEVVHLLLNARADTNHRDRDGCSPLITASRKGVHKHVRLLCEGGATVHQTDDLNRSALHYASWYGFIRIVRIIIDAGGFKDTADVDRLTCLNTADARGHKRIAVFLRRAALVKKRKGIDSHLQRTRRRLGKSKTAFRTLRWVPLKRVSQLPSRSTLY